MRRAPGLRGVLWIAVVGLGLQTGCIHNHYYGTTSAIPGCPPVGTIVKTEVGSVCDVPSGPVVVSNPSSNVVDISNRAPVVASSSGGARLVISQPAYGPPSIGQSSGRFKWRKPDPESLPTMKAEGALDDSILR